MSGLAAHAAIDGPGDVEAVRRAMRAAPHRGKTIVAARCGRVAVGIIRHDERDGAGVAVTDRLTCAVAGRVDNLADVVAGLRASGTVIDDESPPAVVAAGFAAAGDDILTRLRGAYAIAITDGERLWCFRDQLGSGPLFYRQDERGTWVASEAKQVVAAAGIAREPDLDVLEAIFYGHREDTMPSALRGVSRLPKASVLVSNGSESRIRRYWDPANLIETSRIAAAELKPAFEALMTRAVARVLRGDDILAVSGGIDSPTVAAYGADTHRARFGRPLPALAMVFPDYPSADESRYIAEVVERFGLELHAYQPPVGAQHLVDLDRWTQLTDGPWMGWWEPGMDEDRYTRLGALGFRNLLTGDFAEFEMAIPYHLVTHLIWRRRLRALAHQLRDQRRAGARRWALGRQVASAFLPSAFFRWYRSVRRVWPVPEWIDPARTVPTTPVERMAPWRRWRHLQVAGFVGPGLPFEAYHIFNESRRISVRWPWADVDLWEFFVSLPAEVKFPGAQSKQLVRGFIRGRVPDSIVDRRVNTVLDEFVQRNFDLVSLRRWIEAGDFRLPGVDYPRLRARLERGNLQNWEYEAAKDVAQVHAFLAGWDGSGNPAQRRARKLTEVM